MEQDSSHRIGSGFYVVQRGGGKLVILLVAPAKYWARMLGSRIESMDLLRSKPKGQAGKVREVQYLIQEFENLKFDIADHTLCRAMEGWMLVSNVLQMR